MTHLIGSTWVDRFSVIDSEGQQVTGLTFTDDQNFDPDGGVFEYTVTELGGGLYQVRFDLALAGTYYLRLVTEGLDPFQVFEFEIVTDGPEVDGPFIRYFTIRDDAGNYYGGSTLTVVDAYDPEGNLFVPIFEDLGNGLYSVTWDVPIEGVYTLRVEADLSDVGDEPQLFEFELRVEAAVVDGPSPFVAVTGNTLDDIVRAVAVDCKDYLAIRATSDSDRDTWPDNLRTAARPPKAFKGAHLFVLNATVDENVGQEARVTDSVSGALQLTPPLPGNIRRGDRGYLVNLESNGFDRDAYIERINTSLRGIFPNSLAPMLWTFTDRFDATTPHLRPPAEFTHISSVSFPNQGYEPNDTYVPLSDPNREGWWWDAGLDAFVLGGGYRSWANDLFITIRGWGRWPELINGTDRTGCDFEWLVQDTAANLIWSLRDPKRQSEAANRQNRADVLRDKAATELPPNTIQIRQ